MQVFIKSKHAKLNPWLKQLAQQQLVQPAHKLLHNRASKLQIQFLHQQAHNTPGNHTCVLTLSLNKGPVLRLSEVGNNFPRVIHSARDRLVNLVSRAHAKRTRKQTQRKTRSLDKQHRSQAD